MHSPKETEFLVRFICESDEIEGIIDDPALVKAQLERKFPRGHVGALRLLNEGAARKAPLTDSIIKRTQSLIVGEQHEKGEKEISERYRGEWRDVPVRIGGHVGLAPARISSHMSIFIEETARWQKTCAELPVRQQIEDIARFHYEYEDVHPFIDGNGRSGRALVYYLYRFASLTPFIFTAEDRYETYYQCFRDPAQMIEYFLARSILRA